MTSRAYVVMRTGQTFVVKNEETGEVLARFPFKGEPKKSNPSAKSAFESACRRAEYWAEHHDDN